MGYDAITLGNHEFEYGWQTLKENMPRAAYPVLNANIKFEQNNAPFASPYTIVERDGIRVGVIGVMGVDAFYNTMWKGNRKGLTIDDPIKTTQSGLIRSATKWTWLSCSHTKIKRHQCKPTKKPIPKCNAALMKITTWQAN